MKLTNQQIEIIDRTLVLNGMVYDDVKLELIDHIATEIEVQMFEKPIPFDVALRAAFEHWSEQFHLSTSFWVNTKKAVPRMLLDKWILESKKKLIRGSIISILLAIFITILEKNLNNSNLLINLATILQLVFSIQLVAILAIKFFIWKSERKSFSGFLFQTQTRFAVLFMLFMFCFRGMPLLISSPDFKINLASNFMAMFYMVVPIFFLQSAFKHFKFLQTFKTS